MLWLKHFVGTGFVDKKTGVLLSRIENVRLAADYTGDPADFKQASTVLQMAETFVQAVEALLVKTKLSQENSPKREDGDIKEQRPGQTELPSKNER